MQTRVQVLDEADKTELHERTLNILERTGVRVDTTLGRDYLRKAGANIDESTRVVRFPSSMVETSLNQCPKQFSLGARRPGWDLEMNSGDCTLLIDNQWINVHLFQIRQITGHGGNTQ